jgi:hypothetical protein
MAPTSGSTPRATTSRAGTTPWATGPVAQGPGAGSAGKGPAGRYLRQREYPQPPPPSTSSTTRTINKVSISHHLPPRSSPDVLDSFFLACQVSENRKNGPVNVQMTMTPTALANAQELPVHSVARRANFSSARPTPTPFAVFLVMTSFRLLDGSIGGSRWLSPDRPWTAWAVPSGLPMCARGVIRESASLSRWYLRALCVRRVRLRVRLLEELKRIHLHALP